MAQLAIAWCLKNPYISTVITGASKPWQVVENMKALEFVEKMDNSIMDRIETVLGNKPKMPYDCRLMN
jgi:aryl-alcohol dehydrogenase-like predicted oxidoreductase